MRYRTTSSTTELTRSIRLTSSTAGGFGHGIYTNAYEDNMKSTVNLNTSSVDDEIIINASGHSGNGITLYAWANADLSTNTNVSTNINANVGGELQNLTITTNSIGINSSGGVINVNANTVINSLSTGINAGGYAGQINMSGTLEITSMFGIVGTGSSAYNASVIDLSKTSYTKLTTEYDENSLAQRIEVIDQTIGFFEKLNAKLATITDNASADAATPELIVLGKQIFEIQKDKTFAQALSDEEQKSQLIIEAKERMKKAFTELMQHGTRLEQAGIKLDAFEKAMKDGVNGKGQDEKAETTEEQPQEANTTPQNIT